METPAKRWTDVISKTVLPIMGWVGIAMAVVFCGVSIVAFWRGQHWHNSSEFGFAVVCASSAVSIFLTSFPLVRSRFVSKGRSFSKGLVESRLDGHR